VRKNKIVAVLMITVFLLMTATTGAVAKKGIGGSDFKDLDQAKWAQKHVYKMKAQNVITG